MNNTGRVRRAVLRCAFGSAIAGLSPIAAHAQHVVTEDEAAKLTGVGLTAAPPRPVYRPIYRAYYRPAMATHYARERGWHYAVTRVSYRFEPARHRTRHRRR